MKKFACLIFAFVLVSCAFAAGTLTVPGGTIGTFSINNQSLYSPYPVEPGKYMDLWLRVQYKGEKTIIQNAVCAIEPKFPFSFDSGESFEKIIGTMSPFDEVVLKYRLRIDANAVQGPNTLVFKCKSEGSDWIGTELSFYIQTHDAILSIEKVESIPEKLNPGETGKVNLLIKNLADNTVKDISINLDLSSTLVPFAPVNSTTEKRMSDLPPKSSSNIAFEVIALQGAIPTTYKVPVTLTYSDDLGNEYSKSTIIALTVQSKQPDVILLHEQATYIRNGTKNSVTISIVNKGDSQIKFITSELKDGEGYQILSPREVYVGSINSDDSDTASFDLFIDTSANLIQLPMTITFSDVEGNKYATESIVDVAVFSREAAINFGIDKAVTSDPLILGLGAVIGLYLLYRIIKFVFFRRKKA